MATDSAPSNDATVSLRCNKKFLHCYCETDVSQQYYLLKGTDKTTLFSYNLLNNVNNFKPCSMGSILPWSKN